MGVASGTEHLGPIHAKAVVPPQSHVFFGDGSPKARPTGSRLELCTGIKQRRPAADALVETVSVKCMVFSGERSLGACLSRDCKLFGCQQLPPFRRGLGDPFNVGKAGLFSV